MSTNDSGKTVNLCEDMTPHTHDVKSYNKLRDDSFSKKKKVVPEKSKDKLNFRNYVKNEGWEDED